MIELAGRFADEHPVVNSLMIAGIVVLLVVLVVCHRPITRWLHALDLWFMRARGVADPEPDKEKDQRD